MTSLPTFYSKFLIAAILFLTSVETFAPQRPIVFRVQPLLLTSTKRDTKISTRISMAENQPNEVTSSKVTPQSSSIDWLQTIGSTTSVVVAGTFYLVLAWKRDALMVSFFIGSISNGILSKVLKKILKQQRPAELVESSLDLPPSDNGMPSSHAMSLGFIGTFTALQLPWTAVPLLLYVVVSLIYRVKSKLHTVEQILVGVTVGSLNGMVWRSLCMGNNPWGIDVMDWVTAYFLNEQGVLPWYGLAVPAVIGVAVVGSVERRISRFLSQTKQE